MTDDLKYIVNEINKTLDTDYNLISFDSLPPEGLLQILIDALTFFGATTKFEVKFSEKEETIKRILESLKKIQYRPNVEPMDLSEFRRNILQCDKKTIYPIFRYVFENSEKIKHLTYLSQFLLPIALPPEAMANPEIANLWNNYLLIMDEFKNAHKTHTESSIETAQLKELRNDINAINMEKENVKKRIERTQSRLDKVPQQDIIFEAAHVLRLERDRQKELQSQLEEQIHELQRSRTLHDRLQKDLSNARTATQGTSPKHLVETMQEVTSVMEFMVKQKLPQEVQVLKQDVKLLSDIIDEPNVQRDYIVDLQEKLDIITKDVQQMVEKRLAERGTHNDTILPYRQQAVIVARNKDTAAEQLNEITVEFREVEKQLQHKQQLLQETIGEVVLRGDDLKQYVNTLRAKSSVYKQQRAELATVKAEVIELAQTLENLKSQDPTLSMTLEQVAEEEPRSLDQSSLSRSESPIENRGLTELSRVVDGLTRTVTTARNRVTPLSQKIRPLRERVIELKDERDQKKQVHETLKTTLDTEASVLLSEISETEKNIKRFENEWQDLKTEYNRAENLLERVRDELNNRSAGNLSVKESLQAQIKEQERLLENLESEKINLFRTRENRAKQYMLWSGVKQLMEVKINCLRETIRKGLGGTLSIEKNSETFILQ